MHTGSEIYSEAEGLTHLLPGIRLNKKEARARARRAHGGRGGAIFSLHCPAPGGTPYEAPPFLLDELQVPNHLRVAGPHGPVVDVLALLLQARHPCVRPPQLLHHLIEGLDCSLGDGPERNSDDIFGPGEILVSVHVEHVQDGAHPLVVGERLQIEPE